MQMTRMKLQTPLVERLAKSVLEPLSQASEEFLRPIQLNPTDLLDIELSDDGRDFICEAYQRTRTPIHEFRGSRDRVQIRYESDDSVRIFHFRNQAFYEVEHWEWNQSELSEIAETIRSKYLNNDETIAISFIIDSIWELRHGKRFGASRSAALYFFKRIPEKQNSVMVGIAAQRPM